VVDRHWSAMTRWIDYLQAHSNGLLRPAEGYGDWLNVDSDTPRDVIGTAFFAWSTKLVAEMAAATGRDADAARYEALARDVAAAFNRAYVSADGTIKGDTQTGYVLALRFGLLPEELRARALQHLVDDIESRDWHLSTGFLGTPHLLPVLEQGGRADVAYRLLRQDSYPSWLYQVRMGATTVWERWDSIRPDGTFQDPGMNSFNHYGFGAVGDWMYRSLAGIRPAEPGYRKIEIRPVPGSGLAQASGSYDSPYGRIESGWRQGGGGYELNVAVPPNTTATVYVPTDDPDGVSAPAGAQRVGAEDGYAVFAVGSGRYAFRSPLTAPEGAASAR
jgi:alpha-L-rhamnosidase